MQLNKNARHCFSAVYAAALCVSGASAEYLHLFVGDMPSKPELDALTKATLSNYPKAASVGIGSPIFDNGLVMFHMPLEVQSTLTGKLGWAVIESNLGLAVVDVGLANDGSVVQVADVNAVTGNLIEVFSVTARLS